MIGILINVLFTEVKNSNVITPKSVLFRKICKRIMMDMLESRVGMSNTIKGRSKMNILGTNEVDVALHGLNLLYKRKPTL